MASSKELVDEIVEVTGVARSAIHTITRRLSEADFVARGVRGHAVTNLRPRDCGNMILGALVLGDGYDTVSARIVGRVREVGELRASSNYAIALGDSIEELDNAITVTSQNDTFADILARLLVAAVDVDVGARLARAIDRIGVSYNGRRVAAWIEFAPGLEGVGLACGTTDGCSTEMISGPFGDRLLIWRGEASHLYRETSMDWDAIRSIAERAGRDNAGWAN